MIRLLILAASICICVGNLTPVIHLPKGSVQGLVKKSFHNKTFWSFTGIPYAKPPINELRFANPEEAKPWSGVLNATKYGPRCIQKNYIFGPNEPIEGDEDCLYINVYVPQNTGVNKLPVFVYFHWGGLLGGGADDRFADPRYFMDFKVTLVTFHYRLGVFGFLSTMDDEAPGNYGLKDQVLALKWVQDNIEFFGGIKGNVTIIGAGAGGASVHLHMLSDATNGLFSKAVSHSDSALALYLSSTNAAQLNATRRQAGFVNCSNFVEDSRALIKCLRGVSAKKLLETQDSFKFFYQFPLTVWSMVQEKASDKNPTPYLTRPQLELMEEGHIKKVPWLLGITQREALVAAAAIVVTDPERSDLNRTFESTMTRILGLSRLTNNTAALYKRVSDFYLNGVNTIHLRNQTWLEGYMDMWHDRFIVQHIYDSLKSHLKNGHDSIYFYYFQFLGSQSYVNTVKTDPDLKDLNWGVCTSDDLIYMWHASEYFHPLKLQTEIEFSKIWLGLWVNFATYGNPNADENKILKHIDWKPLEVPSDGKLVNKNIRMLNVTGNYTVGPSFAITSGFYKKRMEFWENAS